MASYTPNLNLYKKDPIADGNDFFNIKTMMNDNWDKIDEKVKDALDDIGDLQSEQVRIATGSYVGTGTYGASNPCSLTFDFAPRIVLLSYSNAALSGTFIWPPFIYGETIVTCYAAGGQIESGDTDVYLSFDDNKIEWYTSNVNTQGNRSNFNYFWCAIG